MSRGAVNLTINAIVVIVFALAMLGLGLAFIRGAFTSVTDKVTFPLPDIDATATETIVLPFETLVVRKGVQAEFSINFYNNENETLTQDKSPIITQCVPDGLGDTAAATASVGQTVEVGSTASYKALFTIPSSASSQKYACNLQIGQASKQFFVQVQ